jgi:hypothetical protein
VQQNWRFKGLYWFPTWADILQGTCGAFMGCFTSNLGINFSLSVEPMGAQL